MLSSNKVLVVNGTLQVHEGYWRSKKMPYGSESLGARMYYYEAESNCQSLGTGWRLPTFDELKLLFRFQKSGSNKLEFASNTHYWTSTLNVVGSYDNPRYYGKFVYALNGEYAEKKSSNTFRKADKSMNYSSRDLAACKCVKSN